MRQWRLRVKLLNPAQENQECCALILPAAIRCLFTAMTNETLCKVLCHNLVVLIHEMHELGIEPTAFSKSENPARPGGPLWEDI